MVLATLGLDCPHRVKDYIIHIAKLLTLILIVEGPRIQLHLLMTCFDLLEWHDVTPQRTSKNFLQLLLYCLRCCRPDIVLPFMEYLRDQSIVEESAALLVAWLDLLTGMASGEEGARNVFQSLLTSNAGKHFSTVAGHAP